MIAALLLAVANPPQSLHEQIVPNPTGRNGYELYVRAADELQSPDFRNLVRYEAFLRAGQVELGDGLPTPVRPPGLPARPTFLDWSRLRVEAGQRALSLVRQGNQLSSSPPRDEVRLDTLFPEYAPFRRLTRLLVDAARMEFSRGNGPLGATWLIEGLKFSRGTAGGAAIGEFVAIRNQTEVVRAIEQFAPSIPVASWAQIETEASLVLGPPTSLLSAARGELSAVTTLPKLLPRLPKGSIPKLIAAPEDASKDEIALSTATAKELDNLTPEQLAQLQPLLDRRSAEVLARLEEAWRGPEAGWKSRTALAIRGGLAPRGALDELAHRAFPMMSLETLSAVADLRARTRAQMRLLVVASRIERYRWQFRRLPEKLDTVAPDLRVDALTGKPIVYLAKGTRYELRTEPVGEQGAIRLGEIGNVPGAERSIDP